MQIINNIVFLSFHNLKANILLEKKKYGVLVFHWKNDKSPKKNPSFLGL